MSEKQNKQPKKPKFSSYWIYGLVLLFLFVIMMRGDSSSANEVSYSKFKE